MNIYKIQAANKNEATIDVYKEYMDILQKHVSTQQDFINILIEFIQEAEQSDIGNKNLWFRKQAKKLIKIWTIRS